jgi:hypothetical protein
MLVIQVSSFIVQMSESFVKIFGSLPFVSLVWILGHVLTGWDGTNPLRNPSNLCACSRVALSIFPHKLKHPKYRSLSNVRQTNLRLNPHAH